MSDVCPPKLKNALPSQRIDRALCLSRRIKRALSRPEDKAAADRVIRSIESEKEKVSRGKKFASVAFHRVVNDYSILRGIILKRKKENAEKKLTEVALPKIRKLRQKFDSRSARAVALFVLGNEIEKVRSYIQRSATVLEVEAIWKSIRKFYSEVMGFVKQKPPGKRAPMIQRIRHLFKAGWYFTQAGFLKDAKNAYRKILKIYPGANEPHFELGMLFKKDGNYKLALEHFRRYCKKLPASRYKQAEQEINFLKMMVKNSQAVQKPKKLTKAQVAGQIKREVYQYLARRKIKLDGEMTLFFRFIDERNFKLENIKFSKNIRLSIWKGFNSRNGVNHKRYFPYLTTELFVRLTKRKWWIKGKTSSKRLFKISVKNFDPEKVAID